MGAGKTSIGRQLARRLKRPFYDSDRELERRTGVDIPTIFEYEGEAGFRLRESAVLDELTRLRRIVLATGGGAVIKAQNREWLIQRGFVVYLRTGVDTQLRRTARDRNRPLLQTEDPRARLEELARIRGPLYRAVADLVVDTEHSAIPAIVNRIVHRYRELDPHV